MQLLVIPKTAQRQGSSLRDAREKDLRHLEYANVFLDWSPEVVFGGKADPL